MLIMINEIPSCVYNVSDLLMFGSKWLPGIRWSNAENGHKSHIKSLELLFLRMCL